MWEAIFVWLGIQIPLGIVLGKVIRAGSRPIALPPTAVIAASQARKPGRYCIADHRRPVAVPQAI